jgi:hypothetical protein
LPGVRATLPFKSNRGGRCFAASKTGTSPDRRLPSRSEKKRRGKERGETIDKYRLLANIFLLETVMNTPVDLF